MHGSCSCRASSIPKSRPRFVTETWTARRCRRRSAFCWSSSATLTKHAYRITDEQVQGLREAGWTEPQIAEAVYIGAMFNLFVRLADAFDIHPPAVMDPDGVPGAVTRR